MSAGLWARREDGAAGGEGRRAGQGLGHGGGGARWGGREGTDPEGTDPLGSPQGAGLRSPGARAASGAAQGEWCPARGWPHRPGLEAFIFTVGQGSAGWSYFPLTSV